MLRIRKVWASGTLHDQKSTSLDASLLSHINQDLLEDLLRRIRIANARSEFIFLED
jgi:hypothetical protein